jgi:hypothetical protein
VLWDQLSTLLPKKRMWRHHLKNIWGKTVISIYSKMP